MTTTLHNIAARAADFAHSTNNYMQEVRYIGQAWSGVRDYAVFPTAKLAVKYVGPFFNTVSNFVFANAKPLTIGGAIILLAATARYGYGALADSVIADLKVKMDAAQLASDSQKAVVAKLEEAVRKATTNLENAEALDDTVADKNQQIVTAKAAHKKATEDLDAANAIWTPLKDTTEKTAEDHTDALGAKATYSIRTLWELRQKAAARATES